MRRLWRHPLPWELLALLLAGTSPFLPPMLEPFGYLAAAVAGVRCTMLIWDEDRRRWR